MIVVGRIHHELGSKRELYRIITKQITLKDTYFPKEVSLRAIIIDPIALLTQTDSLIRMSI